MRFIHQDLDVDTTDGLAGIVDQGEIHTDVLAAGDSPIGVEISWVEDGYERVAPTIECTLTAARAVVIDSRRENRT